jgi:hypothetical protein
LAFFSVVVEAGGCVSGGSRQPTLDFRTDDLDHPRDLWQYEGDTLWLSCEAYPTRGLARSAAASELMCGFIEVAGGRRVWFEPRYDDWHGPNNPAWQKTLRDPSGSARAYWEFEV